MLGLAPMQGKAINQSFVQQLFLNGIIKQAIFGIYVDVNNVASEIQFGGYNSKFIANGSYSSGYGIHNFAQNSTTGKGLWEIYLTSVSYGDNPLNSVNTATFNSGTDLIIMPIGDFQNLTDIWKEDTTKIHCSDTRCFFEGDCNAYASIFIPIGIQFNDGWVYPVPSDQYLVDSTLIGFEVCMLGIMGQANATSYVLGNIFLKDYYSIYNQDQGTIGLASNINNKVLPYKAGFQAGPIAFLVFIGVQSGIFIFGGIYLSCS